MIKNYSSFFNQPNLSSFTGFYFAELETCSCFLKMWLLAFSLLPFLGWCIQTFLYNFMSITQKYAEKK